MVAMVAPSSSSVSPHPLPDWELALGDWLEVDGPSVDKGFRLLLRTGVGILDLGEAAVEDSSVRGTQGEVEGRSGKGKLGKPAILVMYPRVGAELVRIKVVEELDVVSLLKEAAEQHHVAPAGRRRARR